MKHICDVNKSKTDKTKKYVKILRNKNIKLILIGSKFTNATVYLYIMIKVKFIYIKRTYLKRN